MGGKENRTGKEWENLAERKLLGYTGTWTDVGDKESEI